MYVYYYQFSGAEKVPIHLEMCYHVSLDCSVLADQFCGYFNV